MVSGLSSSVRRTSRKAASLRPKICGAREGIANWCSEWKKRCWDEVALRDRAHRAAAQHRHARRADVPAPRGDERVRQPAGVAPAVAGGELGDVAMVVAQLLPELLARDVQQRVQPPLVVGDPVVVDPRLGRQPVRRGVGRRQRVVGLRGGRRGDQREHGEDERRDPAHARFYIASGRGVKAPQVWWRRLPRRARCAALTAASREEVCAGPAGGRGRWCGGHSTSVATAPEPHNRTPAHRARGRPRTSPPSLPLGDAVRASSIARAGGRLRDERQLSDDRDRLARRQLVADRRLAPHQAPARSDRSAVTRRSNRRARPRARRAATGCPWAPRRRTAARAGGGWACRGSAGAPRSPGRRSSPW